MFTGNKTGVPLGERTEKVPRTKIPVFTPELPCLDRLPQRSQERAFLRVAMVTGKDIGHDAVGRLIDDERFAGQRPPLGGTELVDAMFTRFEAVAIDNFDPLACKPGHPLATHVRDNGHQLPCTIAHELGRGMRLEVIEFIVDGP